MDSLIFNVSQLLKEPTGATRQALIEADLHQLTPDLVADWPDAPATISGPVRLMRSPDGVLVQGRLEAELELPCSRCLEPVPVTFEVRLEEVFAPTIDISTGRSVTPEEEDRALWIDGHHQLDVSEVLRQNVLLALPVQVLCRTDCRGLCPQCGQDLNRGNCDCKPEPDPRWSALVDLLG